MQEPRNLAAIKRWLASNRPDLVTPFENMLQSPGNDGLILMTATAFEAGRMFQAEETQHPDRYVPMEELY